MIELEGGTKMDGPPLVQKAAVEALLSLFLALDGKFWAGKVTITTSSLDF